MNLFYTWTRIFQSLYDRIHKKARISMCGEIDC